MASYPPPTDDVPIFDRVFFNADTGAGLSLSQATALFLARTDTAISIADTTSFTDNITIGNSILDYISTQGLQIKPTVNSEAVFLRVLDGTGATKQRIECNQTHTHLYDQTRVTESATPTNYTSMQQTGTSFALLNTSVGGSLTVAANTTGGSILINAGSQPGITVTATSISLNKNINLPPTMSILPTAGQLGFYLSIGSGLTAVLSGSLKQVSAFSIPAGVYILTGSIAYTCTTDASVTKFACGFSTSNTTILENGQTSFGNSINYSTQTFVANPVISFINLSCIVSFTATTSIYLLSTWIGTGAFTIGGSGSYTKIA